jgi:YfiH family protein
MATEPEDTFAESILHLSQKHTATIFDAREECDRQRWQSTAADERPQADAFLLNRSSPTADDLRYAIITADCLPVLIRTENFVAGVHAGWRGLAAGIIEKTLYAMGVSSESQAHVLIGPAAGPACYQVRQDVIDALGDSAAYLPDSEDTFLLDMPASATARIRPHFPNVAVEIIPVCTMTDSRFHSYRREGPGGGRNFSYVVSAR